VKQTYRILAGLVALGVLVQAAAIAFAWFDVISQLGGGAVLDENSDRNAGHLIHSNVGMMVIPAIALILLIVSFFANKEVPGAAKWGGIVFGLTVLQVALAFASFSAPVVGALHGINALLLFAAAGRAAALTRTPAAARPAAGTSVPV
jgi:heme A synthase